MKYTDRHKNFAGKVIISYPFHVGGQFADRWMWMAELDGEVLDYNNKKSLIDMAIAMNKSYVVLRWHRDGTVSEMNK